MTAALYNTLPNLGEAEERFHDREEVFAAISSILAPYGPKFGVCLVHAHCTLADDEIMLAKDRITQPTTPTGSLPFYPASWLANGEAYEFTSEPTETSPSSLFAKFRAKTEPLEVLGLYYNDAKNTAIQLEWTEDRMNATRDLADGDHSLSFVETAWQFGGTRAKPEKVCVKYCDSLIARSGAAIHKRTQSHVKQTV